MPRLDQIIITPTQLHDILQALNHKKHSGPIIIIDAKFTFTIRDIDNQFITEVKKEEQQ